VNGGVGKRVFPRKSSESGVNGSKLSCEDEGERYKCFCKAASTVVKNSESGAYGVKSNGNSFLSVDDARVTRAMMSRCSKGLGCEA